MIPKCRFCGVEYRLANAAPVRRRGDDRPGDALHTEAALRAEEKCQAEMVRHEFFCGCATCRSLTAHGCAQGRKCDGRDCAVRTEDAEKLARIQEFEQTREDIIRKQYGGKESAL